MRVVLVCLLVLVSPAVASAAGTLRFFHSPSGNIDCFVASDSARCDIRVRSFAAPKRPARCDLEWGSSLSVAKTSRRGGFACVGDTTRDPRARALAYGHSIAAGSLRCTSRTDGVRCVNRRGHGFLVGRAAYRLF
ncbi:MAG: hypothetical protein QOI11_3591 [Candidatus Eremiobacteraeota bacterium]|nr:hypothetical protein [Candidatus Eremiobacteraeota bacterium]